jgi:hypothetical protein
MSRYTEDCPPRDLTWGNVTVSLIPALTAGHLLERILLTRAPESDLLLIGAPAWAAFLVWGGSIYLTVKLSERWGLR